MMTNIIPSRLVTYVLLLSILTLNACKKKEEAANNITYLRYVNVSPTLGTYNIYANDKKVNPAPLPFGGTVSFSQYASGALNLKFTTASNLQSLLTKDITLTAGQTYSLYLVDKNDNMDALLITDNMTTSTITKASVRFINLSPDAPALNLDIAAGASLVNNKAYKSASEYATIDPDTYTFEIKDSSSGEVKATLSGVVFEAGRYYTIISRGMLNPEANDQSFSGQVIINQ